MTKSFKGRVVVAGDISGKAMVSHNGLNTLATFYAGLGDRSPLCHDQGNKELYQKHIAGTILCIPTTIGSTTGGMILQGAARVGIAPKAILYAKHIDTVSSAGVLLAKIWDNIDIVCVDQLGDEFLATVKEGDTVTIKSDGTVTVG